MPWQAVAYILVPLRSYCSLSNPSVSERLFLDKQDTQFQVYAAALTPFYSCNNLSSTKSSDLWKCWKFVMSHKHTSKSGEDCFQYGDTLFLSTCMYVIVIVMHSLSPFMCISQRFHELCPWCAELRLSLFYTSECLRLQNPVSGVGKLSQVYLPCTLSFKLRAWHSSTYPAAKLDLRLILTAINPKTWRNTPELWIYANLDQFGCLKMLDTDLFLTNPLKTQCFRKSAPDYLYKLSWSQTQTNLLCFLTGSAMCRGWNIFCFASEKLPSRLLIQLAWSRWFLLWLPLDRLSQTWQQVLLLRLAHSRLETWCRQTQQPDSAWLIASQMNWIHASWNSMRYGLSTPCVTSHHIWSPILHKVRNQFQA